MTAPSESVTKVEARIAGTRLRLWASEVDSLATGGCLALIAALAVGLTAALGRSMTFDRALMWLLPLWLVAEVVGTGLLGANLGKRLYGLRVVDENLRPPGLRHATVRALVLWGPSFALGAAALAAGRFTILALGAVALASAWPVVVLGTVQRHPLRRGVHDILAGTWVIDGAPDRTRR